MTFMTIIDGSEIKPGMRFLMPAGKDSEGNDCPETDWLIERTDNLGNDLNGNPILNKRKNKFACRTDDMKETILCCFDDFKAAQEQGFKFYAP